MNFKTNGFAISMKSMTFVFHNSSQFANYNRAGATGTVGPVLSDHFRPKLDLLCIIFQQNWITLSDWSGIPDFKCIVDPSQLFLLLCVVNCTYL